MSSILPRSQLLSQSPPSMILFLPDSQQGSVLDHASTLPGHLQLVWPLLPYSVFFSNSQGNDVCDPHAVMAS